MAVTPAERAPDPAAQAASVLIPLPLPEPYDYAAPAELALAVGDVVSVPLGPRRVTGVVAALRPAGGMNRALRPVEARLDAPPIPPATLEFVAWAAHWSVDSPGMPLAMTLRGLGWPAPRARPLLTATQLPLERSTPARLRVLEAARQPSSAADLARAAGVTPSVVKALTDCGALAWTEPAPEGFDAPDLDRPGPPLNPSQAAAASALTQRIGLGFGVALVDGVTGSGKTEVYIEAVAAALRADPQAQALVLMPEIALTSAVLERFERRFGARPVEWHSGVPGPKRRRAWEAIARGEARIVVGARSALFLPFRKLGLVVVDEEHDGSYKQEDGFIYQARDMAVARAKIENCLAVLASATPSLESLWNAHTGRYLWLRLGGRHGVAELPQIRLIDLRAQPPEAGRWLSPPVVAAMAARLEAGEQSLLFLNRRGYAPLVLCRACGERLKAPDTDSWLVEHRYSRRLVCHLTGFSMPKPEACPHCAAKDSLISVGPGVERVEEECRERFPEARIAVFSSDTAPDAKTARALVEAMTAGEIDILVATQAAAKGHNFPNLTLVGVVDADVGLRGGDLRAAERTFQLLTQVSGRAGRHERPGEALVQTYAPDHPVMGAIAAHDRDAFAALELAEREAAGLPPFGRLAALIVSAENPQALETYVRTLAAAAPNAEGVEVFGPTDAPLALVRGRRRKRLLVRADRSIDLQAFLAAWRARAKPPASVRLTIDVDPYSFL